VLNVSRQALWQWIKQGKIEAVERPSWQYRIPEAGVVRCVVNFVGFRCRGGAA